MKWKVEYDNDSGARDEGFYEWWTVTDGTTSYDASSEEAAKKLAAHLNATNF